MSKERKRYTKTEKLAIVDLSAEKGANRDYSKIVEPHLELDLYLRKGLETLKL